MLADLTWHVVARAVHQGERVPQLNVIFWFAWGSMAWLGTLP